MNIETRLNIHNKGNYLHMKLFRAALQVCLRGSVLLAVLISLEALAQPIESHRKAIIPPSIMASAGLAWMTLDAEATTRWTTQLDAQTPTRMVITPHSPDNDSLKKQILVLIPKKSKSYRLAVNTLLKVLDEHQINAQLTLVHFNKNPDQAQAAIAFAEQQAMDLIFAIGSVSVGFIHENYRGGTIPVVTATNKDPVLLGQLPDYEQGSGTNIAYTSLNVPVDIQMQYLFDLKRDLRTVALLYNQENKQTVATEVVPFKQAMLDQGVIPIYVTVESAATAIQDLQAGIPEAIQAMRKHDPELRNSLFWITGSTAVFTQIKLINQLANNIPVLGSISNVVAEGEDSAVMAIGIDRRNNAFLAGLYAVDILTGKAQPGELKLGVVTPPDLAINFRTARKIGLKIPLHFFESAAFIYDYNGKIARAFGQKKVVTP